jgi:Sulphur transport
VVPGSQPHLRSARLSRPTPVVYGIVAALLAVLAQMALSVAPPPAFGICMACHAEDATNWTMNVAAGTHFSVSGLSRSTPLLTTVGVILGAMTAAWRNHELRWRSVRPTARPVVLGAAIMVAALVAMGCPTRLWLRFAYGEPLAVIAVIGLVLGIASGTAVLRWRAGRV